MERADALISGLVAQRNDALNNAVNLHADLVMAQQRIAELEARVKELEAPTE